MNQIQLAVQLDQLLQAGPNVFLKLEPEMVDFTQTTISLKLLFFSKTYEISLELDSENLAEMITFVKSAIFADENISIICWNIKSLFTYILAKTHCELECNCKLLDLKLAECFIGIRGKAPNSFDEAVARARKILSDSSWVKFKNIYQRVYLPLLMDVIPKIETEGVFNTQKRQILFPCYQIEGQVNGRLACQIAYDSCFNPHSLDEEQKALLQPKGNGLTFVSFDYMFMEVCILAWLSRDELLMNLVSEKGDFYKKLFKLVSGTECDTEGKRSFCKDYLFLPVVYGQTANTLAERAKISMEIAGKLVYLLKKHFAKLFDWVENYPVSDGVYVDYVGRKGVGGRNFVVQSPAAMFCLEKLVNLYKSLKNYGSLVAHIDDGYTVQCGQKQVEAVSSLCIKALESESELFPGLNLRVNFKISNTLT